MKYINIVTTFSFPAYNIINPDNAFLHQFFSFFLGMGLFSAYPWPHMCMGMGMCSVCWFTSKDVKYKTCVGTGAFNSRLCDEAGLKSGNVVRRACPRKSGAENARRAAKRVLCGKKITLISGATRKLRKRNSPNRFPSGPFLSKCFAQFPCGSCPRQAKKPGRSTGRGFHGTKVPGRAG